MKGEGLAFLNASKLTSLALLRVWMGFGDRAQCSLHSLIRYYPPIPDESLGQCEEFNPQPLQWTSPTEVHFIKLGRWEPSSRPVQAEWASVGEVKPPSYMLEVFFCFASMYSSVFPVRLSVSDVKEKTPRGKTGSSTDRKLNLTLSYSWAAQNSRRTETLVNSAGSTILHPFPDT